MLINELRSQVCLGWLKVHLGAQTEMNTWYVKGMHLLKVDSSEKKKKKGLNLIKGLHTIAVASSPDLFNKWAWGQGYLQQMRMYVYNLYTWERVGKIYHYNVFSVKW